MEPMMVHPLNDEQLRLAREVQELTWRAGNYKLTVLFVPVILLLFLAATGTLIEKMFTVPSHVAYPLVGLLYILLTVGFWRYVTMSQRRVLAQREALIRDLRWPAIYFKLVALRETSRQLDEQFYLSTRLTGKYLVDPPLSRALANPASN